MNVLILGFRKGQDININDSIKKILDENECCKDSIITTIFAKEKFSLVPEKAPHIVVRNNNIGEAKKIAKIINTRLGLKVEFERIDPFR